MLSAANVNVSGDFGSHAREGKITAELLRVSQYLAKSLSDLEEVKQCLVRKIDNPGEIVQFPHVVAAPPLADRGSLESSYALEFIDDEGFERIMVVRPISKSATTCSFDTTRGILKVDLTKIADWHPIFEASEQSFPHGWWLKPSPIDIESSPA